MRNSKTVPVKPSRPKQIGVFRFGGNMHNPSVAVWDGLGVAASARTASSSQSLGEAGPGLGLTQSGRSASDMALESRDQVWRRYLLLLTVLYCYPLLCLVKKECCSLFEKDDVIDFHSSLIESPAPLVESYYCTIHKSQKL